jgi:hypothetical protein
LSFRSAEIWTKPVPHIKDVFSRFRFSLILIQLSQRENTDSTWLSSTIVIKIWLTEQTHVNGDGAIHSVYRWPALETRTHFMLS